MTFIKSQFEYFCNQAELHETLDHCAVCNLCVLGSFDSRILVTSILLEGFFLLLTFEALLRDKKGDQRSWCCFGYASISYDQKPHTWIISLDKLRYFCLEEICGKKFVIVNALRFLHIRSWKIICIVYELCNVPKWSTVPPSCLFLIVSLRVEIWKPTKQSPPPPSASLQILVPSSGFLSNISHPIFHFNLCD